MSNQHEIHIRQVDDGYIYTIKGPHRLGGERVCKSTEEEKMLERIGEVIFGYKIKITRK